MMLQTLKALVPTGARPTLRRAYDRAARLVNRPRRVYYRIADPLVPPDDLIYVGGTRREYKQVGEKVVRTLVDLGGLRPSDRVLDVGCGTGRIAVPLVPYLAPSATYVGFDIVREGVEWAQRNITRRFPNFRFDHADVCNLHYNPRGRHLPAEYRFPYESESFDFAFLTSVFTHMRAPEVENYLREIARVLRPGGRCVISFFLLNDESLAAVGRGEVQPGRLFSHDIGGGLRTTTPSEPETAIAFPEETVRAIYGRAGLEIVEAAYGAWCGRANGRHSQDYLVARKA